MVVAALIEEGGTNAKQTTVRQAVTKRFGIDKNAASEQLRNARGEFIATDLVKLIKNAHTGDELSLNPRWEFQLRKQCGKWLKDEK